MSKLLGLVNMMKIKNVLGRNESALFLQKAREINCDWYFVWFASLYTGMRSSELKALRWEDVS